MLKANNNIKIKLL